jgi:hypothetical protein
MALIRPRAARARRAARRLARGARLLPLAAAVCLAPRAGRAQDTLSYPAQCGVGAPAGDGGRYVPLPRGEVFCPLIADPKAIRSFASYQRGRAAEFATNVASVGIADQFAFFRFGGRRAGDGVQFGVSAGVYAQFDLDAPSLDLLNADYVIGLPLTFRHGGFSGRARVYHQSSHLGDEFLLRPDRPDRENLSFESAELLVSQDVGPVRAYAGGEYFLNREPEDLPRRLVHAGVELRPRAAARLGTLARARFVAGADLKVVSDSNWTPGVSVRAGIEVGRPREGLVPGRRWSLLGEFYDGPSPYGQFHRDDVRLAGVGFHFTL